MKNKTRFSKIKFRKEVEGLFKDISSHCYGTKQLIHKIKSGDIKLDNEFFIKYLEDIYDVLDFCSVPVYDINKTLRDYELEVERKLLIKILAMKVDKDADEKTVRMITEQIKNKIINYSEILNSNGESLISLKRYINKVEEVILTNPVSLKYKEYMDNHLKELNNKLTSYCGWCNCEYDSKIGDVGLCNKCEEIQGDAEFIGVIR